MEKRALVLLAQGCEELEAVTIIDLLRRGGIQVVTAGLTPDFVVASRGVKLIPDTALDRVLAEAFDLVVLPGGLPGADNLALDDRVLNLLRQQVAAGRFVGAICAAPVVLAKAGLLKGKRATCYPGMLNSVKEVTCTGNAIEKDGNVVTSRGPGTALDFGLILVEMLMGRPTRDRVEQSLVR